MTRRCFFERVTALIGAAYIGRRHHQQLRVGAWQETRRLEQGLLDGKGPLTGQLAIDGSGCLVEAKWSNGKFEYVIFDGVSGAGTRYAD